MEDPDWEEELQLRREAMALWACMVAERNLPAQFLDIASASAIEEALKGLTHARLDREHILLLEPAFFLCLRNLSSLYLQQNELTSLNGIETAKQLQFLTVAGNQLTSLQGLQTLPKLTFLDASDNKINHISPDSELPNSLHFLNISENPCCKRQKDLQETLVASLSNLKEFRTNDSKKESSKSTTKDEFLNALEQSINPKHHTATTQDTEKALQNSKINEIIDISAQQYLQDAGSVLKPIVGTTREQVQRNFDKIRQRSHIRALEEETENALKKSRKPLLHKAILRSSLDIL